MFKAHHVIETLQMSQDGGAKHYPYSTDEKTEAETLCSHPQSRYSLIPCSKDGLLGHTPPARKRRDSTPFQAFQDADRNRSVPHSPDGVKT